MQYCDMIALVVIATVFIASCQLVSAGIGVGHCPHVSAVHVSDWNFAGMWYEIRRVKSEDESGERCNFEEYDFRKDQHGWNLRINSTGYTGEEYRSSVIDARQYTHSRNSALGYFVLGEQKIGLPKSELPNFFILHADDEFSLAYFCQNFGSLKMDLAWVMSRDRHPDPEKVQNVEEILRVNGIGLEMIDVSHDDCPVVPGRWGGMRRLLRDYLMYSRR
ncbi:uncharacterized protein LOC142351584 isoform X2 [Convolutriloba macropyga]|uniref:uncharacterized protein LOC142351584 isoform X2 n=1 Tax=Convolutriloba macropyga TaxID=536237 RepID=UPI003F51D5B8